MKKVILEITYEQLKLLYNTLSEYNIMPQIPDSIALDNLESYLGEELIIQIRKRKQT